MQVNIIDFPETKIAVIEHVGAPEAEGQAIAKLVAWRKENGLAPSPEHRSYGVHYNDPRAVTASAYRVDLAVSVLDDVLPNTYGVINKCIPACRCAVARHIGSRDNVEAAAYLYQHWLPRSGEQLGNFPIFFHYLNVGPHIAEQDMLSDVYLPLG